ncbi:hypothetical protein [Rivularia sp. UHCC 0363]|uniref:hypothetical protein n=1 Tax=Rivularia sp. UHCC 0363 TaxID=3110244 RepID=UPI002B203E0F|nr:hypothetical protein [Rivularia sp. UHCC 0363]MEA5597568.1 hypothetical protein [Rivularia sp. UHCC 0363]
MNNKIAKIVLFPLTIVSAIAVATVPFNRPVMGQIRAVADGNMTEYSPVSAPVLKRGTRSQAVKDVQLLLNQNKFYLKQQEGSHLPEGRC